MYTVFPCQNFDSDIRTYIAKIHENECKLVLHIESIHIVYEISCVNDIYTKKN
jgi:hypothetical protein